MAQSLEKLPPHSPESEQSVLGSLLIDDQAIVHVSLIVTEQDFFTTQHADIYRAMKALYEQNEAINQVTVANELEAKGKLADIGGIAYLMECISTVPTSLHADHYARIVHEMSIKRQLIQAAGQIAQSGFDESDSGVALAKAEELLYHLREAQNTRGFVHIREAIEGVMTDLATVPDEEHRAVKVPTGYSDLDSIIGGLHGSDLIILAARPSMGKTSLLLNIAENVALKQRARVGIFSLEMSKDQLVHRLIASHAGVDLKRIRLERLSDSENHRAMESLGILSECPIWIDDNASQTVSEMRSKAKRLSNQHGLDLVIVDYIGLVKGSSQYNRVQEVAEISHAFKALAKDLDVPVLVASQLNRSVEARSPHVPMLSDLRESGDLEQDADVVLFIYREDVYTSEEDWQKKNTGKPYPRGIAEIIVAKHRNGPTGQCSLLFREQLTRFETVEREREERQWWKE